MTAATDSTALRIALDIGGSHTAISVMSGQELVLSESDLPTLRDSGGPPDLGRATALLDELIGTGSMRGAVSTLCIAAASISVFGVHHEPVARWAERHHLTAWALIPDSIASYVAGLGRTSGAVIAAGTGVVATGFDGTGWTRSDGWGHLVGDTGGGAWIGAQGLAAALRHEDRRRDGSAALHAALVERFGSPDSLCEQLYGRPDPATTLAAFAPVVAQVAQYGDPTAVDIWQQAGRALARTLGSVLPRGQTRTAYAGGLFGAGELLLEPFRQELREIDAEIDLQPTAVDPLTGCDALAQQLLTARGPDVFLDSIASITGAAWWSRESERSG